MAGAYWVIEDRLTGERPHRYDLRFHLAPEAHRATHVDAGTVLAPGLALVVPGADTLRLEPGWVSPELRPPARGTGRQRRRGRPRRARRS